MPLLHNYLLIVNILNLILLTRAATVALDETKYHRSVLHMIYDGKSFCRYGDALCEMLVSRFPTLRLEDDKSTITPCLADDLPCPVNQVCAQTSRGLICIPGLKEGDTCVHAGTEVCADGLECIKNKCKRVLSEEESCDPDGSIKCATGLLCVGVRNNRRCVRPMDIGQPCGSDPFWVCQDCHVCRYFTCVNRIKIDDECNNDEVMCEKNSICVFRGGVRRCTSLDRPDDKQWVIMSVNQEAWIYVNGNSVGHVYGWQNVGAVGVTLNMGDVLSFIVQGGDQWSGFIASIGAYQSRKPAWSIRTGVQEFLATTAFQDDNKDWMNPNYDACGWKRVKYAATKGAEVGEGQALTYPYWTGARWVWGRDVGVGELIYVRFKRGGHNCPQVEPDLN